MITPPNNPNSDTTTIAGVSMNSSNGSAASGTRRSKPKRKKTTSTPSSSLLTLPNGDSMSNNNTNNNNNTQPPLTVSHYLSRMVDVQQMDLQAALDQMWTLCTIHPQRVYKTSYYRKQTKNHWARDDPAFCALQILFLLLASFAYTLAFFQTSNNFFLVSLFQFNLHAIVFHWLGTGLLFASIGRTLANRHLTVHNQTNHVKQRVEWLYAFDIHCNAFFPLFLMLYTIQFFLLPVVLGTSIVALTISNTLYAAAFSWYFYITHLGYRALPFLSNTEVFLFPIVAVLSIYVLNFVGYPFGLGWNASRLVAHLFFD